MEEVVAEYEKCKHTKVWWGVVALCSLVVGSCSYMIGLTHAGDKDAFFCSGPERPTITSHTNKKCDYTSGSPVCPEEKISWWKIECK